MSWHATHFLKVDFSGEQTVFEIPTFAFALGSRSYPYREPPMTFPSECEPFLLRSGGSTNLTEHGGTKGAAAHGGHWSACTHLKS